MPFKLRWLLLVTSLALAAGCVSAPPGVAPPSDAAQRMNAVFERYWEESLKANPERATFLGDPRYADRLTDNSPPARAARAEQLQRALTEVQAIPRDALAAQDKVSYDVFIYNLKREQRLESFEGYRTMSLGSGGGFHGQLSGLLLATPVDREADARNIFARFDAYPLRIDQEIARLRLGKAQGWVG